MDAPDPRMWSRGSPSSVPTPPLDQKVIDALQCIADTPVTVLHQANPKLLHAAQAQVSLANHVDPIPQVLATFNPLPPGPFALIVITPPWARRGVNLSENAAKRSLTIHDLIQLDPVSSMAPDSVLGIWGSGIRMPDAYLLGATWGLSFAGVMFVQVSLDSKTHIPILKSGVFTKSNADFLLMFTRGNPSFTVSDKTHSQIIFSQVDDNNHETVATAADIGAMLSPQVQTRRGPRRQYRSATGILFHPGASSKTHHPLADDFMDCIFRGMPKCQVFTDQIRDGWIGYGPEAEAGDDDIVSMIQRDRRSQEHYQSLQKSRRSKSKRKRLTHTAIDDDDSVSSIIKLCTTPGPKPKRKRPLCAE